MSTETVDHPPYYGGADSPYEAIKVIEAWHLGFCLGNAVKCIARAGKKGSRIEDLKKARWYVDREITRLMGGVKTEQKVFHGKTFPEPGDGWKYVRELERDGDYGHYLFERAVSL